jgi:hypothetical protein
MFLTILLASVPVLLFCLLAAADANRKPEPKTPEIHLDSSTMPPSRFFGETPSRLNRVGELPVELMVSQIERHVRLEQAAAEIYLQGPNRERLHSRATSTTLN